MQPTTYLTAFELAAYLAERYPRPYNKRTIDNWRHLGRGPIFCKQAGRVLYKLEDVQLWEAHGGVLRRGAAVKEKPVEGLLTTFRFGHHNK